MNVLTKAGASVAKALMRCKPIAKAARKISRNKPEIMAGAGGLLILGAFGWAIYEAIGTKEVMEASTEEVKTLEASYALKNEEEQQEEAKEHAKKLRRAKVKGIYHVTKRFAGPTITLVAGMALGAKGFAAEKQRMLTMAVAAKGYESLYKFYRENVKNDLGEEADQKYARGIIGEQELEKTVKNVRTGEDIQVKRAVPVTRVPDMDPWRFEFSEDQFSTYVDDGDTNLHLLQLEQEWWQHELDRYDQVSMYDILKHLRFRFDIAREGMTKQQYKKFIIFLRSYGYCKGDTVDLGLFESINAPVMSRQSNVVWIQFQNTENLMVAEENY